MNHHKLISKVAIFNIIFLCLIYSIGWTATYYVDATNGNDGYDGHSEVTPWKTIAKINSSRFNPGDQILFKRGEVWRETLIVPSSGATGNPIIFGAYGSGNKLVISGADIISEWSDDSYYVNNQV